MKKSNIINKIALLSLMLLAGCGYNNTQLPSENSGAAINKPGNGNTGGGNNGGNNGSAQVITFANVKDQVFQPLCIRCHSNAGGNRAGINLETYARVQPDLQLILGAVESGSMPPSGNISAAQKTLLVSWIQSGAPEFDTTPVTPPTTSPAQPPVAQPTPPVVPPPVDCDDHVAMEKSGVILTIDENFFFDSISQTVQRRHDDCDDRQTQQ